MCVFITAEQYLLQSCSRGRERESGGHVLRETTRQGQCELVCPSRTNERGGEGYCVKDKEEGEKDAQGCMSIYVYCLLVIRAGTYECNQYGQNQIYKKNINSS